MNTRISFKRPLSRWVFLLLALAIVGFMNPQSGQAEFTLEPEAITGVFNWVNTPVETPDSFGYMGNKSLRIDTSDRPRVVYGGQGLYYATWTGSAWDIKTVDSNDGVGYYASQALDSSNVAYIAYYDSVNADLKYAKGSGSSWTITVVDGKDIVDGKEEEVGAFASIDIDNSKNPHIVYFDDTHDDLLYVRWTGSQWSTPEKIDSTGVVGLYISMYMDGNDVHVSYYDYTHKSLKYAVREDGDWTVSTVDDPADKNVGTYTSIDVDYLGFPHISYYNETDKDLKYAMYSAGTWNISVVDENGGKYSAIETDSGVPHISYFLGGNLHYATKPNSTWQTETVDTNGDVGYYTSLAVDDSHDIHISYYRQDTGELRHAENIDGDWDLETIISAGNLGLYTSIATGTNGQNYISYYDGRNGDLKFAQMAGPTPTIATIDSSGTVGQYSSLALTNTNDPRIAYYDATNTALKFASRTGTTWSIQTVDNTNDVGQYASLAIDSGGAAHIAYYDVTNTGIRYVVQNGTSWTTPQQLDWVDDVGKYVTLALDNNNFPHIAYYDTTNTALKYVYWTGTVWSILTVDNSADVGQFISLVVDAAGNSHISYYDATNNTIRYAFRNGATWTTQVVAYLNATEGEEPTFSLQSLLSTGNHATAIQVDSANLPFIAFYHTGTNILKFAQPFGNIWIISDIDDAGQAGEYLSMDFGPNEHPYLSYFSTVTQGLKFAVGVHPASYLPLLKR
ncbi:MAG: hypothetical protein H6636_00960 [Anaerolineales bacterium]|nr:hypothetical protein [Anaerolineales bacterium]